MLPYIYLMNSATDIVCCICTYYYYDGLAAGDSADSGSRGVAGSVTQFQGAAALGCRWAGGRATG